MSSGLEYSTAYTHTCVDYLVRLILRVPVVDTEGSVYHGREDNYRSSRGQQNFSNPCAYAYENILSHSEDKRRVDISVHVPHQPYIHTMSVNGKRQVGWLHKGVLPSLEANELPVA